MYKGKYEDKHREEAAAPANEKMLRAGRVTAIVMATVLLLALAIGGTVAWLSTKSAPITNTFTPSKVACKVTENFNGTVKTNVNVENTGDTQAFIRVKLVTYRTNNQGQHIGGTAELPEFELGTGWVKHDGYYYYTKPVEPNQKPEVELTKEMPLKGNCDGADGGHQAIDVMAEAIQSVPQDAVQAAWGLSIDKNGNLIVPPQN